MSSKIFSRCFYSLSLKCTNFRDSTAGISHQTRNKSFSTPKPRYPYWYTKQDRAKYEEFVTEENRKFIDDIINETYAADMMYNATKSNSPLKNEPIQKNSWFPKCMRSGLIAVKLGYITQWLKSGKPISATMLQVVENHVIDYIPPGSREELRPYAQKMSAFKHLGSLVVGAVNIDPQNLTKEYCGLFNKAGVMPKKLLTKFYVHPEAVIQPGTPLYAAHFKVGDLVDITGKTISRGFQGVMKRWGFHGMPASHGQTKTHRRPGNIGGGGEKARVWPGTKMPGHVGNKTRSIRNLTVLRINHKYNVIYVSGCIPGAVNSFVYVHDAFNSNLTLENPPRFPTYFPHEERGGLPEEEFCDVIHNFNDPTIEFSDPTAKPK